MWPTRMLSTAKTGREVACENEARGGTLPIVIADDHERERSWLKDLVISKLPHHGAVAAGSRHDAEAVALVKKHKPNLVFLDIGMPVMSGIKAAEQIIEQFPTIPILILSIHSDEVFVF